MSHYSWKKLWLFVWVPTSAEKRESLLKLAQLTHLEEAIFRAPGNGTAMIVAENAHYLRQIEPLEKLDVDEIIEICKKNSPQIACFRIICFRNMFILETPLKLSELVGDILGRPTKETDPSPITTFHISPRSLFCLFMFFFQFFARSYAFIFS